MITAATLVVLLVVVALARLPALEPLAGAGSAWSGTPGHQGSGPWGLSWFHLLPPLGLAALFALLLEQLPRRTWSRILALAVLVLATARYLLWRLDTLDHGTGLALATGGLMLSVEALYLLIQIVALAPSPLFDPERRRRQADQLQPWQQQNPASVDIWVCSGHEEERVVRRALIASANVDHPRLQVSLIDRVGREAVREIAESLGVRYVQVPQACQGKESFPALVAAALPGCSSDLVAVFDCRFMPFANFLQRTLGFFQDSRVAMVQTPISLFGSEFYNRNLGADQVMPGDRDLFFHYNEVVLDRFNSVQPCGGSSVIRRSALQAMQADPLGSGRRESTAVAALQRRGHKVVYLDEMLSIGEAPRTFASFLDQLLDHRHDELAIIRAGGTLSASQLYSPWHLVHQAGRVLSLLTPLLRISFLLLPLFALLMGFSLMRASVLDYLIHGVPLLLLLHSIPRWLTDHHYSRFWSEVSEALTAVPSLALLLGRRPLLQAANADELPAAEDGVRLQTINLNMAWPFLLILVELMTVLFLRYALPLIPGFESLLSPGYRGEPLMLLWNLHNGWVMIVCLICAIDQPVRRQGDRIPIRRSGRIELEGFSAGGITIDLSETGAAFLLNEGIEPPEAQNGTLRLDDTNLQLPVSLVRRDRIDRSHRLALRYQQLDAANTGLLLRLLYGGGVALPAARRVAAIDAFRSLIGGIWGANPVVRRY